ncbi:MAG: glutathione S-transferase family protein [Reyranellaceae bacterium]
MSAPIVFYYASGSPYAWRVWLALDVRRIPYEMKLLSFDAGDLQKPNFVALNPRQRVPVIVEGDLVLRESAAIVEYLDEREGAGNRLFAKEPKARARQRQMIREADNYLARRMEELAELLFAAEGERNAAAIATAAAGLQAELDFWNAEIERQPKTAALSAVDVTVFPILALVARFIARAGPAGATLSFGPALSEWFARIEGNDHVRNTRPPHWK